MSKSIQGTVVSTGANVAPGARRQDRIQSSASELTGNTGRQGGAVATLLPIMAVVFIAYLVIGLAMPVLPIHVHQGLGLGTFVVGLVAGSQFTALLLSRFRVRAALSAIAALCQRARNVGHHHAARTSATRWSRELYRGRRAQLGDRRALGRKTLGR